MGLHIVRHDLVTEPQQGQQPLRQLSICISFSREGNGTPLQYFCLENPTGGGAWGSDTTEWLHFHFSLSCIGEGNGNPLQCSCLENPKDWGAWWADVYGVSQSQTRLKWLSAAHTSRVTLKILQARLQKYVNCELPDVQAEFRKDRRTRDQIANIH